MLLKASKLTIKFELSGYFYSSHFINLHSFFNQLNE